MSRRSTDGDGLLAAFQSAQATLEEHVPAINALNVFPVPDGDTGSNMLATLRAATAEAASVRPEDRTVSAVASALGYGALMGARGNSGVILSQVLRGFAEALAGRPRMSPLDLAHALTMGSQTAHRAVARPVEGTILTVVRDAAAAAVAAAEHDPDMELVLAAAAEAAEESVARTPALLPVLREAGVVDAGGEGLYRILQGALRGVMERIPAVVGIEADGTRSAALIASAEEGFGYETMFLVSAAQGRSLDLDAIRGRLAQLGESVLVAGDGRAVKVHVHNDRPDLVLGYGLSLGPLSHVSVENLDRQAREAREARALEFAGAGAASQATGSHAAAAAAHASSPLHAPSGGRASGAVAPVAVHPATGSADGNGRGALADVPFVRADAVPHAGPPVVAVAAGEGIVAILRSFGVAEVVGGGQSQNPSAGELLRAAQRLEADEVLVLPNNPNVKLAAEQAATLSRTARLVVVPTRNAPEGFAAMLAYEPGRDAESNATAMLAAARGVQTLEVTDAVRDARIGGRKVRKGHTIVLDPDDGLVAHEGDRTAAILAGLASLRPGYELLTVYYGEGADLAEAESLTTAIRAAAPGIEVELVHGGQPHYRYLLAAE